MTLYSRHELPGNHAVHINNMREAKEKRMAIPRWLNDDHVRGRILRVYALYIARHSLPEIMEAEHISVSQIYKDLGRAREMRKLLFIQDVAHILMEQVEARKQIIQEARTSLVQLREGSIIVLPGGENIEAEGQTMEERTPQRARAEADLLRVISEQEQAIEELIGLRDKGKKQQDGEGSLTPMPTVTVVVDVRRQQLRLESGHEPALREPSL